jgi:indolepyruvate ferredoxin oxidoreductase beta subunit
MQKKVINVVVGGLGGQGVLKASDILARTAFRCGYDVKKSEVHGMSQRGGSVTSDVRFGNEVGSPMVPQGEADFVLVLSEEELERNRRHLKDTGVMLGPEAVDQKALPNPRSLNVALLGALSRHLDIPEEEWLMAVKEALPRKLHDINTKAFALGRSVQPK